MITIINVLDRIVQLRKLHNWSEYQLAEESGVAQSTISSWYRKGIYPSIPTLEKVCNAFGISLAQFFIEEGEMQVLNEKQQEIAEIYCKLTAEQQHKLYEFLKSL